MTTPRVAISIITFERSELLQLCLESLEKALINHPIPIYIISQDPSKNDEILFEKFQTIVTEVIRVPSSENNVEDLINRNRIKAWEKVLIEEDFEFCICLENDVEVSEDFVEFTMQVLTQNMYSKDFMGINYGSFEITSESVSYSNLRYGIHGPASLISKQTYLKFGIKRLSKLKGKIAWDSWVEPINKIGFMATSNIARYRDNGHNGTHASIVQNHSYFHKLAESFKQSYGIAAQSYKLKNISHSWRNDCQIYASKDNWKYRTRWLLIRSYQYAILYSRILMGQF